jgi:hypothetical protein
VLPVLLQLFRSYVGSTEKRMEVRSGLKDPELRRSIRAVGSAVTADNPVRLEPWWLTVYGRLGLIRSLTREHPRMGDPGRLCRLVTFNPDPNRQIRLP